MNATLTGIGVILAVCLSFWCGKTVGFNVGTEKRKKEISQSCNAFGGFVYSKTEYRCIITSATTLGDFVKEKAK